VSPSETLRIQYQEEAAPPIKRPSLFPNVVQMDGSPYQANTTQSTLVSSGAALSPLVWNRAIKDEGNVMAAPTHEEINTKIALATTQTDLKFAQLIGRIDTSTAELKGEIGKLETHLMGVEKATSGVKATIVVSILAAMAIVVGILAFGQQWFGVGLTTRDIIRATVTEERIQHPPNRQQ
jgi:hypothetical protein